MAEDDDRELAMLRLLIGAPSHARLEQRFETEASSRIGRLNQELACASSSEGGIYFHAERICNPSFLGHALDILRKFDATKSALFPLVGRQVSCGSLYELEVERALIA
jgi:hypothetical protein